MQDGINVQGDFFLKNNKLAGPNKAVQGEFFLKIDKRACMSTWYTRVHNLFSMQCSYSQKLGEQVINTFSHIKSRKS